MQAFHWFCRSQTISVSRPFSEQYRIANKAADGRVGAATYSIRFMSARKLGGGRILGSGKGLVSPDTSTTSEPTRPSSLLAPSEASTPSHGSQDVCGIAMPSPASRPPLNTDQDLTANISLGAPSMRASDQLFCPICEEGMVTLLQLNRHIDDVHQELPEIQQDEVKSWFDKQVSKAKKFQPLSVINQKLRGLDVFEPNETPQAASSSGALRYGSGLARTLPEMADPEEMITRKHWQRTTGHDICTDPACGKGLGPLNGSINCRCCGKLFCEVHTMYQMKLSRAANSDPVRGYWARVCETCYKSRAGFSDHRGAEIDLTGDFMAVRKKRIERHNLEIARLEKRLSRLTQLLAQPGPEAVAATNGGVGGGAGSLLSPVSSLSGYKHHQKTIEQSVVAWEDDATVSRCRFCQQEFGSWTFRRHHCRVCGRIVCADPKTKCSTEVGFCVAINKANDGAQSGIERTTVLPAALASEKRKVPGNGLVDVDIRMCRDCRCTVFSKRDFEAALAHKPADQRAYETLRQFEWGIRQMLPLFQRALQALQPEGSDSSKSPPTHAQIQEAAKIRKRLMDSFAKYNLAAVRLRDLKTDSATQQRLQRAVFAAASNFLHANMVPLKHVPRMLRAQKAGSIGTHRRLLANLNGAGVHLSQLRNSESLGDGDSASVAGSEASTAVSALESEEKELREKLVVLEEQRFIVQQMMDNARGSRRFEEVGTLSRNVEELDKEIARLQRQVSGVEERWEVLYAAGAA